MRHITTSSFRWCHLIKMCFVKLFWRLQEWVFYCLMHFTDYIYDHLSLFPVNCKKRNITVNFQVGLQSRGDISRQKYCGVWECVLARYWWAFCRAALISINSTRLPWKRTSLKEPGHLGVNKIRRFHSQWVFWPLQLFNLLHTCTYIDAWLWVHPCIHYFIMCYTNGAFHKVHLRQKFVLKTSIYRAAVILWLYEKVREG